MEDIKKIFMDKWSVVLGKYNLDLKYKGLRNIWAAVSRGTGRRNVPLAFVTVFVFVDFTHQQMRFY